ncbi:hypothetical protein O0F56_08900 [Staphylococcus pseudintermedius]|uniref:hypothetical protein n=2 Tax=Staphylococcus pseudintermedius TaxID=283734 RepID=UPI0019329CF4|nr:hypothetical protein [Staphylococcus pseudintermedius]EGQ1687380.1 hypothetical protein [Staphylococcus pseudintermedius]EGQ2843482.1 hypothetical protein [Staphylococcus pseudintermedius]EGQ3034584.1 hypothetical protein [Staphylococcus pseudintermedius]EGQ3621686.1 hypothetical protein [Staphylococcus pseudintermedius]EGQ3701175.1 hypothetical protein [Staphylococcus pseudintermedius]
MDIIIDVYSKFVDNKNKIFVFNNKEVEMKISNSFATDNETVFVLALKYKDTFEIFEIYQLYFSDYITIKAKYESVDVRSKEEFDFALERIVMRYM